MIKMAQNQRGLAILMVLLIVALLTTILAYAAESQLILMRRVTNQKMLEQSYQLAMGAEQWIINVLYEDLENEETQKTDHKQEVWNSLGETVNVQGGSVTVTVSDLSGVFNLNSLFLDKTKNKKSTKNFEAAVWVFNNLLLKLELDTRLTGNLVDWMDTDDSDSPVQRSNGGGPLYIGGAEDFHYTGLSKPYRAANQKLSSVGELRFVKGFNQKAIKKLAPYVTVLPTTQLKINVNTASEFLLEAMAKDFTVPPSTMPDILAAQQEEPWTRGKELIEQSQAEWMPEVGRVIDVRSQFFMVTSEASFGDLRYSMQNILYREFDLDSSGKPQPAKVLKRERVLL